MKFFLFVGFSLLLTLVLFVVVWLISFSLSGSFGSKSSSFECGFQPFSGTGVPFSMPFFVVSLMFLLFDVEIILVCFFPMSISFSYVSFFFVWLVVGFILLATLYEWVGGVLVWI
uniref:NADH dehydrogenase subunit 3 n=1 Tax=Blomia tropicalis TaxID=40697 RepID=UPI001FF32713|nr:NADH dehydrogenase subunit 3 [Blomia tropicalis]UOG85308.1 NADH dehydrogenase subunit 3 [Blomia tropicalis]